MQINKYKSNALFSFQKHQLMKLRILIKKISNAASAIDIENEVNSIALNMNISVNQPKMTSQTHLNFEIVLKYINTHTITNTWTSTWIESEPLQLHSKWPNLCVKMNMLKKVRLQSMTKNKSKGKNNCIQSIK